MATGARKGAYLNRILMSWHEKGLHTPEEIETRLQDWLKNFTNASASGGAESGARFPLRDSRIEIREKPGQPGAYGCVLHLQPPYQLDEVGAAFRLVTDPQAARAAA